MTNSDLFTAAHKITKKVLLLGDSYQATFGICLAMLFHGEIIAKSYDCEHFQLELF